MVLDSQMPRSGFRRSYMSTARRRRTPRWPWVAIVIVAVAAVGLYGMFNDDGQPSTVEANGQVEPGVTDQAPPAVTTTPTATDPRVSSVQQMPAFGPKDTKPTPTASTTPPAKSPPAASPPASTASTSAPAQRDQMLQGMKLIEQGQVVEGRTMLSKLLTGHPSLSAIDEQRVRDHLASVNQELVFGPKITPGDPLAERYVVQSGDLLARIAPRYKVTYQFLEQINQINARNLQAGKTIKLMKGPFFAVVSKSQFRMDIFLMDEKGSPVYARSFPVGLGENDYTPTGTWIVKKGSKTANPDWRNPKTGEYFAADDPKNPIGEYWLALEGLEGDARDKQGFGIHGTIDPSSIGRMMSMGCVRMNAPDIEQVFKLLLDGESKVYIVR